MFNSKILIGIAAIIAVILGYYLMNGSVAKPSMGAPENRRANTPHGMT